MSENGAGLVEATRGKPVNSVLAAFRVLEEIAEAQPVGVSDLARRLDMPKSSVQRLANTLHEAGWLRTVSQGGTRWALSMRAFTIGQRAVLDRGLRESARPVMEELLAMTAETVHLLILDGGDLISVDRFESPNELRIHHPLGGRAPYHATSPGKAVLASLPEEEARRRLPDDLPRYTDFTIVDRAVLLAELPVIRERGFASNRGEWRDGIGAVAAAIELSPRHPVAALAVSLPLHRFPETAVDDLGATVARAARAISRRLGSIDL